MRIPGKEEFAETLRYFRRQLELHGVEVRLEHARRRASDCSRGFDEVVVATGVAPRMPGDRRHRPPEGASATSTCCAATAPVGERVAIIGAGGIGFDVAEFLTDGRRRRASDGPATT